MFGIKKHICELRQELLSEIGIEDRAVRVVENENKTLKNQLLEARDQIFELVSDRDRPFRFEVGQLVTLDDDEAPMGGVYTITDRRHRMRPGGQWLEGYNEYQLFHECANGVFWEAEIMLEPIVPDTIDKNRAESVKCTRQTELKRRDLGRLYQMAQRRPGPSGCRVGQDVSGRKK